MGQQAKLYIGNLPFNATSKDMINFFSTFGEVLEAMVIPDKRIPGNNKGFGFVAFAAANDAQKALLANGTTFLGRNITIQLAKEEETSNAA